MKLFLIKIAIGLFIATIIRFGFEECGIPDWANGWLCGITYCIISEIIDKND